MLANSIVLLFLEIALSEKSAGGCTRLPGVHVAAFSESAVKLLVPRTQLH